MQFRTRVVGAYFRGTVDETGPDGKEKRRTVIRYFQCTNDPETMLPLQAAVSGLSDVSRVSEYMPL